MACLEWEVLVPEGEVGGSDLSSSVMGKLVQAVHRARRLDQDLLGILSTAHELHSTFMDTAFLRWPHSPFKCCQYIPSQWCSSQDSRVGWLRG